MNERRAAAVDGLPHSDHGSLDERFRQKQTYMDRLLERINVDEVLVEQAEELVGGLDSWKGELIGMNPADEAVIDSINPESLAIHANLRYEEAKSDGRVLGSFAARRIVTLYAKATYARAIR